MAGPITWQNIRGDTGVDGATRALEAAGRSINTGLSDITGALQNVRDTELANLRQANKSNRTLLEDAINNYGTAEELRAAQANGDIQGLLDSFGPNVQKTGLNDLIANRIETLAGRESAQAKRAGADISDQLTGLLADGRFDEATQLRQDNLDILDQANLLGATSKQFKDSILASQKVTGSKVQDEYNSLLEQGDFTGAERFRTQNRKALQDAGLLDDTARSGREMARAAELLRRQDEEYNLRKSEEAAGRQATNLARESILRTREAQQVTEADNKAFAEQNNVPFTEAKDGTISLDISKLPLERQKEVQTAYNQMIARKAQGVATDVQRQTMEGLLGIENLRGGDLTANLATIDQLANEFNTPAAEDVAAVQLQQEANKRALLNNNVFASAAEPNYDVAGDLAEVTAAMKANENISVPNAAKEVRALMTDGVDIPFNGEIVTVPVPKAILQDVINTAGSTGLTGLGQLGWLDSNDGVDLEKAVRDLMTSDKYVEDFRRLVEYQNNDRILRSQLVDSYNGSEAASRTASTLLNQVRAGEDALLAELQRSADDKKAREEAEKASRQQAREDKKEKDRQLNRFQFNL